jgi:hypothetical protein
MNQAILVSGPIQSEYVVSKWYIGTDNVIPTRLTFCPASGACMFCTTPKGDTEAYYIKYLLGFLTCSDEKCKKIAQDFIADLEKKNKFIQDIYSKNNVLVKRTNGTIESNWTIDYTDSFIGCVSCIDDIDDGTVVVHVQQDVTGLSKYVPYNEFLELNKK